VLLIHGIRTRAWWQTALAQWLRDRLPPGSGVYPIKYGYFDTIRLLLPLLFRRRPMTWVEQQLRLAFDRHPGARRYVVAHSFGTYLIGQILDENVDIELDALVLCGSILPSDFRWDRISSRVPLIVNECGVADVWPLLAKSVTWGYGPSGVHGFGASAVVDRHHELSHSGFLNTGFCEEYWWPLLASGRVAPGRWNPEQSRLPLAVRLADNLPLKWMMVAALAFSAVVSVPPLLSNTGSYVSVASTPDLAVEITGQIRDPDGRAVVDARVSVDGYGEFGRTGTDGSFVLTLMDPPADGWLHLRVVHADIRTVSLPVHVSEARRSIEVSQP
jgi:hypothetical protein